jgi:hypothetical protein
MAYLRKMLERLGKALQIDTSSRAPRIEPAATSRLEHIQACAEPHRQPTVVRSKPRAFRRPQATR